MNKAAIEQLKSDEGESLTIYNCTAGVPTIGIGRNLESGISKEESNYLFMNDLTRVEEELDRNFTWFRVLSSVRQGVLINMNFNLGLTRFMTFENMIAALEKRDYEEAAKEMIDSLWWRRKQNRAGRLVKQMLEG